ncbi:MAG: hypothetical protein FWF36_02670 [Propionibacteriaceae bacterium]|nr:hypothetical protein [Propionibacteriaceae bacterium]
MQTLDWMTLRHRAAYAIALGKVLFDRRLSASPYAPVAHEAFKLAWDGWLLRDVDIMQFENLCIDPDDVQPDIYTPLCAADTRDEEAAWRCLMEMVYYAGYFYSQVTGIAPVPQSIENIRAVDVLGEMNSDFDTAVRDGPTLRAQIADFLAHKSGDALNQDVIVQYVAELDRNA